MTAKDWETKYVFLEKDFEKLKERYEKLERKYERNNLVINALASAISSLENTARNLHEIGMLIE